jgi:sugar diacid utilization regulator
MTITDEGGMIIACTDPAKMYTYQPDTEETQKTGIEKFLKSTHSGTIRIILPIQLYNEIVGTFILEHTYDMETIQPVAKMIKMNLETSLHHVNMQQRLQYLKTAEEAWLFDLINPGGCNIKEVDAVSETIDIKCSFK